MLGQDKKLNKAPIIKKALIMAGGTGGHIFPGIALAKALCQQGWQVSWLGSKNGMEERLVRENDISIEVISIKGLRGNGAKGWIMAPVNLLKAISQAKRLIEKYSPNVVIGFGGFVSGPGGVASYLLGRPLLIHEQNAIAGLTNRLLSKIATKVYSAFPNVFKKSGKYSVIGHPIRDEILQVAESVKTQKGAVNLLIIGGSRGASIFNQKLPSILAPLVLSESINVRHQTGEGKNEEAQCAWEIELMALGKKSKDETAEFEGLQISEFISEMSQAYQWADCVICRAGALTVSEVSAASVAGIFVPYTHAVDNHQYFNAKWLEEAHGAVIFDEALFGDTKAIERLRELLTDRKRLSELSDNAKSKAYRNAVTDLVEGCNELYDVSLRRHAA